MSPGPRDLDPGVLAKLRATMKTELRRAMVSTRSILPREARAARDRAIVETLVALPEWNRAKVVAAYVATRGEADPMGAFGSSDHRLVLPRVDVRSGTIAWHRFESHDALVVGAFGIAEPRDDAERIEPDSIDLVLVPGVAFDVAGSRLGLGKGFYDRALPAMPNATRIGIGYDFQLVAEIPTEPHDIAMQIVLTDARVVRV